MDCQLAYICGCIPARIKHALAYLPETLDKTYQRTLEEINKADWEFAHRLFQFVAVASPPLRVQELAELLAFDFEAVPIPKFDEALRTENPGDAVLSACSSLLAVVNVEGSPVIQFSHFSVKEFLTSDRLAKASDIIHRRHHISMTPAHTLASQVCLGTLLHLDKDVITRDSLEDYPLAEYAAEHWVHHSQFEGVSQKVEDGMKQLFDPSKPHLMICIWIHDPKRPWLKRNDRDERPPPTPESPLYYAVLWGLYSTVHFLATEHPFLIERSADVTARDRDTPVHLALRLRRLEIAQMLIERGADVTGRDWNGDTSLCLALRQGYVEVAHMLIEHGADVSGEDWDGNILYLALKKGYVEVVRMLIERGANVSTWDEYWGTLLHMASQRRDREAVHMLIEHGADVSALNSYGETPLYLASRLGYVEIAYILIEGGADVSAQDQDSWVGEDTPLHQASKAGHVEVARMLIGCGADVSALSYGNTPLHLASQEGYVEVTHMLIECGADVSALNWEGNTPLHLALRRGHVEVAHMLFEYGAARDWESLH